MSAEEGEAAASSTAPSDSNDVVPSLDAVAENNANENSLEYWQTQCSILQNQLTFLRSQQKQKKEQRKKEKGEIVSTFKSMKDYIDQLEQENLQYKTVLSGEDDLTVLRQRILTLEREKELLSQECKSAMSKCQSLEDKCTRLQEEVLRSKTTEAQLRDQVTKYEQVVDHVPLKSTPLQKHLSMSVQADASDEEIGTIEESLFGNKEEDLFGKVVDHTPITPNNRNQRPKTTSVSSAVAFSVQGEDDTVFGVTDRAELASIQDLDEEDEEDDDEADGGEEWAGSVAADNISIRMEVADDKNLVDHVPSILKKTKTRTRKYGASSVVVVPDASVASRLDDVTVGDEDDLFGKMVDTTPDLSMPYSLKKAGSSVSFRDHGEDDTVLGVTEKQEIESVARQDDDASSHGAATVDDDETATQDGISITQVDQVSIKLKVAEEKNLVDHVPKLKPNRQQRDVSVVAVADNYSVASPMDDLGAEDAENEPGKDAFGPIVDQLPTVTPQRSAKSVATSVVTQNSYFTDLNDDYERDTDTLGPASTVGDSDWERDTSSVKMTKHLVDFVPKRKRTPSDFSVRVFVDNNDNMSQVDTIAEDEEMEFGPIVDQTPFSETKSAVSSTARSTSLSVAGSTMAVGGGDNTQDYDIETVQDTFMDTGTIASIPEEEDSTEENMVDHVPSLRKNRAIDESVRVLVDANENMSQVDTMAEDGMLDFGPIVDHTPEIVDGAPTGGRSVAASTAAVGDDRTEADMESMALMTTVSTPLDMTLNMADTERFIPLEGLEEEKHVVDHVPSEDDVNRLSMGGSVRVVVDNTETLSVVDTVFEEEREAFGPIVDHTPAFTADRTRGRSLGASILSVGSNDDSTSILDNTTVGFGAGVSIGGGDDIGTFDENTGSAPTYTPTANEDKKLVDHVPQSSFPKSGDVSVMVQADPLDAVFEVDDEEADGNVRTDRFVPIVDHTPIMGPPVSPSVATSMLTTTSDNAVEDARSIDGTWLSGSTERADTLGEVSLTNSRDVGGEIPLDEPEMQTLMVPLKDGSSVVKVETVTSLDDSDDLTDDAYVHVSKEKESFDDGKQSIASDEDGGFDLKEIHSYAEELAVKTSESKQNPFDIAGAPPTSHKVNPDVQDYIAELASGASSESPQKQKYDSLRQTISDLAGNGSDSVTSSTGGHSAQEMEKYIAELAEKASDSPKAETPQEG